MNKVVLEEAVKVVREGGILLYPTDTVWGLGCDATQPGAVGKILALKNRPEGKSFVVLVSNEAMLEAYVREVPEIAWQLIEISEKPLTIVYPGARNLAPEVIAADGSVAIRMVKHPFTSEFIRQLRKPLVSTSANISNEPSPLKFTEISDTIRNGVDYIVPLSEEGDSTGQPSSIIKLGLKGEVTIIRK